MWALLFVKRSRFFEKSGFGSRGSSFAAVSDLRSLGDDVHGRATALLAFAFGLGLYAAPALACNRDRVALTCDAARIQPASYGLVTRGAALASAERYDFWEQFDVDSPGRPITSSDEALAFAAQ